MAHSAMPRQDRPSFDHSARSAQPDGAGCASSFRGVVAGCDARSVAAARRRRTRFAFLLDAMSRILQAAVARVATRLGTTPAYPRFSPRRARFSATCRSRASQSKADAPAMHTTDESAQIFGYQRGIWLARPRTPVRSRIATRNAGGIGKATTTVPKMYRPGRDGGALKVCEGPGVVIRCVESCRASCDSSAAGRQEPVPRDVADSGDQLVTAGSTR